MASEDPKGGPKKSRRHRKGEYEAPVVVPAIVPDPVARQIDPEHVSALVSRAEAFAERRFGPILTQLGASFFQGRTPADLRDEGLAAAFRAWVLYGFRDENGVRIIDMFAAAGIPPQREVARALTAARQARFAFFEVLERNPRTKQVRARDLNSPHASPDDEVDFLDHTAYEVLEIGSVLAGWFVPVGPLWRPIGAATHVPPSKLPFLTAGLAQLAQGHSLAREELAQKYAMQMFWLAFRVANLEQEAQAKSED
jgi:hypothetical protein